MDAKLKLGAKELRVISSTEEQKKLVKHNPIYIILDNVLDTYNIGAIFRLADALSVEKVYLCGGTERPPHHRIKKASINTTEWVDWEYHAETSSAISNLKSQISNIQIVAIEQAESSVPFDKYDYVFPLAFIVGHETDGVSQKVLDLCDATVEMPMFGVNKSLNVMVSLGIVLYQAVKNLS